MSNNKLKGIYAITNEALTPDSEVAAKVEKALQNGASIVQYRNKSKAPEAQEETCLKIKALCRQYGALFFINDHIDLALKIKADGVHTGAKDGDFSSIANKINGQILWGVSCYGDLARAQKAVAAGADYVAFGAFFPSPTKPEAAVVAKDTILKAKESLDVPICVIGGITQANIAELATYQPDMYASVSAVFKGNIADNLQQLKSKIKN